MNAERIYLRLPVPLQNLACTLEGWRIERQRYGGNFDAILAEVQGRSAWSQGQFERFRDERLHQYIRYCATTVPYYRQLFAELGVQPDDIRTLADLKALPILAKKTVQDRYAEFVSEAVPPQDRIIAHTSGTTGGGLRFAYTLQTTREQWAVWWRYRRWHGIERATWCGYFGGRSVVPLESQSPPYWRTNYAARQILFSGYHLSPDTFRAYLGHLDRAQPPWLHGYPSVLALLAGYMLADGYRLRYTPRWITTGAESLLPQQASHIEAGFGVRPLEHYGMAEGCANVSQCPAGKLHVDEDFAATEFIPQEAGGYRVIGTSLSNLACPLVRYEVGDVVDLDDSRCDCGRPGRIVRAIDGRKEDYIVLRNGARLGRMDHIFKDMTEVCEAQLFQDTPGVIVVRIVKSDRWTSDSEDRLRREFAQRVGDQADVLVEYVDRLPRSSTGKLRFVVSQLDQARLVPATAASS